MSNPYSRPMPFRSGQRAGAAPAQMLDEAAGKLPFLARLRARSRARRRTEWEGLEQLETRVLLSQWGLADYPNAQNLMPVDGRFTFSATLASPAEDDLYRFQAPPGASFVSVLADTVNVIGGSTLNSMVRVYREDTGAQTFTLIGEGRNNGVISTTRPGTAPDGWFGFVAIPGEHYLVQVLAENGTTGGYILRVNGLATDVPITTEPFVPPNPFDTREPKTTGEGMLPDNTRNGFNAQDPPAPGAQLIQFPQDEIIYRITTPDDPVFDSLATATARAARGGAGVGPGGPLDTHLEIYDESGALVTSDIETGFLNDAFAVWRSRPNTTYYVRVRSDDLRNPALFPSTGEFQVRVNMAAEQFANPVSDVTRRGSLGSDPNNPALNVIRNSADSQLFTFTAQGTGLSFISAIPLPPPAHNLALRLYNSQGQFIGYNNDFSGVNPRIDVQLTGGETYFLVAEGFPDAASGAFNVFIEAHHTFDPNVPIDDHVNAPNFGLATPLRFGDATLLFDGNGNPIFDRSYIQQAQGTGRIQGATDSDLFMFVPPVDMLGRYAGDNDDVGAALFVGGGFTQTDFESPYPRVSGPLGTWDAGSWWFTGRQGLAPDGIEYGFLPRPGSGLDQPEIYALQEFDPDGAANTWRPSLFVGGDFLLRVPTPFGPVEFENLAVWRVRPTGFTWEGIGNPNGPVRAMTVFDPESFDPDGNGPAGPIPDPGPLSLIIGGDFTEIDGGTVLRLAQFNAFQGLQQVGAGINQPGASVRALAVFDPEDPGDERAASPGPPILPLVVDTPDPPSTLYIGGRTNAGALFTAWNGVAYVSPAVGTPVPSAAVVGTSINAMTVYDVPAPDEDREGGPRLIIAGQFTSIGGVAAQNIIQFGRVASADSGDLNANPELPVYQPRLLFEPLEGQGATNGPIHALTVWDPADVFGGGDNEIPPVLVIGGAFTQLGGEAAQNLGAYDGFGFFELAGGVDGPVFALTVSRTDTGTIDDQEPGIPRLGDSLDPQEALYVGGNFEFADPSSPFRVRGPFVTQLAWVITPFGPSLEWSSLNTGPDGPVFALRMFDDQNPQHDNSASQWDRNDRPGSRAQLVVSRADDQFLNTGVRIYDSSGTLIYPVNATGPWHGNPVGSTVPANNQIVPPPATDPSGALDPSRAPGTVEAIIMPPMWGGEVYYIEIVSFGGVGRYNFTLQVDAVPLDVTGDGVPDDPMGTFFETVSAGEGDWTQASPLPITLANGDSTNFANLAVNPRDARVFRNTPSGFSIFQGNNLGIIHRPDDVDLYTFIAEETGTTEVRLNTTDIRRNYANAEPGATDGDSFYEQIVNVFDGTIELDEEIFKIYESLLHGRIRIFNNDFEEIAFSDGFPGVTGAGAIYRTGSNTRLYTRLDPRVVFNVIRGERYFIQVESGQRDIFAADPDIVDYRHATGSYELLVNGMPQLNFDDDHSNSPALATPIRIGDRSPQLLLEPPNGRGTIHGEIRNTLANPVDIDFFEMIAIANGPISLTLSADIPAQAFRGSVTVINAFGQTVAQGGASPGGSVTVTWVAEQGAFFAIRVEGAGTQGAYTLNINGPAYTDDHADWHQWSEATPLIVNRFFGTARVTGLVEHADDLDLFVYTAETYEVGSVTVESNSPTLDPFVAVYEVNLDGAGNPVFMLIGLNNDAPGLGTGARSQFSMTPGRPYYILVGGADGYEHRGAYTLTLQVTPTDDHPNLSDAPTATEIPVIYDQNLGTGTGSADGVIERPDDNDLFVFTAPTDGDATITITTPDSGLAPRVQLYRLGAGNTPILIAESEGMSGSATLTVVGTLIAGQQYYIAVRPGTTGAGQPDEIGSYTVSITTNPADDHPDEGQFGIATEIPTSQFTGVGIAQGVILPFTDTDLFYFNARGAGQVTIEVTTPASDLAPFIRIFNANQTLILSQGGNGDAVTVTFAAPVGLPDPNSRFYILISSAPGSTGPALTGAYTVRVLSPLGDNGGGGGGQNDDHPNAGSWSSASVIALSERTGDGSRSGSIEYLGDSDLFRFTTYAAGPIQVRVVTPQGSPLDASVRIFNQSQQQIRFNALGLPGATAATNFDATGVQTFYVLVEQVGPNLGGYTVVVDTSPSVHYLYYPEGFSGSTIDEFIPIVNPNDFDVTYTIIARYEVGERDQILETGVIGANSRGGITVSTKAGENPYNVRIGTPYALEIQSSGQLGATLSHYDFGTTTGESFTEQTSTLWTFSEARRDPGNFADFLVFYNPNNVSATVDITLIYQDGTVTTFSRTVDALRRGGVNFAEDLEITRNGVFAIEVKSNVGIVAALSSYDVRNQRGFGLLGNAEGGSVRGVVPSITTGSGVESGVSIFNAGTTTATVTLRASYQRVDLPDLVRVITVAPRSRVGFTMASLGLVDSQVAGLRYTSTAPVTLTTYEYRRGDGNATAAATQAFTRGLVGDAFVNPAFAGVTYVEELALYNPANIDVNVTIRFLFNDGSIGQYVDPTTGGSTLNLGSDRFALIRIDQQPAILNRPGLAFFSILIDAPTPIVASFTHYDLFLDGGWGAAPSIVGIPTPISRL